MVCDGNQSMRRRGKDSEARLIGRIRRALEGGARVGRELRMGIGDDAAILRVERGWELVVSTDNMIEGVHFLCERHPPESIGYKALARATSDLAAKGAMPCWFLLSMGLPKAKTMSWLSRVLKGMARAAREFRIGIIGGDTSRCERVFLNVTVFGKVAERRAILRTGARAGDLIYMTGCPGAAKLGLEMVREGARWEYAMEQKRPFLKAHLFPSIELKFSEWLAAERTPSAMMDVSDGLSSDLARMCEACGLGALLSEESIRKIAVPQGDAGRLDPLDLALHGGEDYGLLFTMNARKRRLFRRSRWAEHAQEIGFLREKSGIWISGVHGVEKRVRPGGWDPFRG
jgi:thiamine-monophosphate kinase